MSFLVFRTAVILNRSHAGSSTFSGIVARMARLSHGRIGTCTKTTCALMQVRMFHTYCSSRAYCQRRTFRLCSMVSRAVSCARDTLHRISTSMKHRSSVSIVRNLRRTVNARFVSIRRHQITLIPLTPVRCEGHRCYRTL